MVNNTAIYRGKMLTNCYICQAAKSYFFQMVINHCRSLTMVQKFLECGTSTGRKCFGPTAHVTVAPAQHVMGFFCKTLFTIRLEHLSEYSSSELFLDKIWDIDIVCMFLFFQYIRYTLGLYQVIAPFYQSAVSAVGNHSTSTGTTEF